MQSTKTNRKIVVKTKPVNFRLNRENLSSLELKEVKRFLDVNDKYGSLLGTYYFSIIGDNSNYSIRAPMFKKIQANIILKTATGDIPWIKDMKYIPKAVCGYLGSNLILPQSFHYFGIMRGASCIFNMKLQGIIFRQKKEVFQIGDREKKYLVSHYKSFSETVRPELIDYIFNNNLLKKYFISLGDDLYRLSDENYHLYKEIFSLGCGSDEVEKKPKPYEWKIFNQQKREIPYAKESVQDFSLSKKLKNMIWRNV